MIRIHFNCGLGKANNSAEVYLLEKGLRQCYL